MWQEEKFAFRISPDISHYIIWLSIGLILNCISFNFYQSKNWSKTDLILIAAYLTLAFVSSLNFHFTGFILSFSVITSTIHAFFSPTFAVALTMILYICRPWEVLQIDDWWLQVPRWCIWVWLFAWLCSITRAPQIKKYRLPISRGFCLIFMMAFWALISVIFSQDPATSFQNYVDTLMRAIILVVVIGLTAKRNKDVQFLSSAFVIGVVSLSLFSLWRFEGYDQFLPVGLIERNENQNERRLEAVGSLGNSNDIAAVVMIPLGFLFPTLFDRRESLIKKTFFTVIIIFLFKAILASQSRGALIASIAQCGILFLSRSKHPLRFGTILLTCLVCLAPLANHVMGRDAEDLDASTESRLNYYITGIRMAIYSPLWGQGFGRYPFEFERFSTETLHEWGHRTAHSSWILVLSETGFVGLLIFALLHIRIFMICWKIREIQPGFLLAVAGYSITIIFLSHSWLMFPWILFALVETTQIVQNDEEDNAGRQRSKKPANNPLDCTKGSMATSMRSEFCK